MKSASKAFLVSTVIALISCGVNPDLGKLFGFIIPAYSAWFDVGFTVSSFLFFLSAIQFVGEEDLMEEWFLFFGIGVVLSLLVVIGQGVFGGNFVLPSFYILSLICSIVTIILFFQEEMYDEPEYFFIFLAIFSGTIFGMGLFVPIIPLMIVFLVPYLFVCGFSLFFLNISKISKWINQD